MVFSSLSQNKQTKKKQHKNKKSKLNTHLVSLSVFFLQLLLGRHGRCLGVCFSTMSLFPSFTHSRDCWRKHTVHVCVVETLRLELCCSLFLTEVHQTLLGLSDVVGCFATKNKNKRKQKIYVFKFRKNYIHFDNVKSIMHKNSKGLQSERVTVFALPTLAKKKKININISKT